MALNSQIEGLLTAMKDAGARPFEDMTVPEARLASWDFVGLQGEAEPVARVMHRYLPGPTADIPVRIYYPNDAGGSALPVIMYFHGSGFVIINIEICDATCRAIANRSRAARPMPTIHITHPCGRRIIRACRRPSSSLPSTIRFAMTAASTRRS